MNKKNNIVKALERILQVPFIIVWRSSRIYSMGYNPKNMDLFIVFSKDYSIYKYTSVPQEVWDKLTEANKNQTSVGKLFHELVIKPKYPYVRMELHSSRSSSAK